MAEPIGETHGGSEKLENTSKNMEPEDNGGEIFEVEKIIGKSKIKGLLVYKVRWKGYGPADDTWEPVENFDACQDLIEEFNEKQKEISKKRAEERKLKLLAMEGRIQPSDESSDPDSPYPSTFKNTFWKELEAGRVNVFDNDMYSKVKNKRASSGQSKDTGSSSDDSSVKSVAKVRKSCDPGTMTASAEKQPTSSRKNHTSSKKSSKSSKKRSAGNGSARSIDFNSKTSLEKDAHTPADINIKTEIDMDTTDSEPVKPKLTLVIKKVPELTNEAGTPGSTCGESSSYTVLSPTSQAFQSDKDSTQTLSDKTTTGNVKHKSNKGSSSSSSKQESQDKKRKVSATSLNNVPIERSKGPCVKVPKHDPDSYDSEQKSLVLSEHKENSDNVPTITNLNKTVSKIDTCSPQPVERLFKFVSENKRTESDSLPIPKSSGYVSDNKTPKTDCLPSSDLIHSNGSSFNQSSDLNVSHGSHRSEFNNSCGKSETPSLSSSCGSVDDKLSMFRDPQYSRQSSEKTIDSGIHSPASDENDLGLIQDGIDSRLLSAISNSDKALEKVMSQDDYLDIDLPLIDWDLFEDEVSPEPITISNDEFARAVTSGDFQCVRKALLGNGKYDVEQPDQIGKTLLMKAVQHGHDDITDLLVKNGADINRQMKTGFTALMIACLYSEIGTVNLLLELRAKVNLQTDDGRTALFMAAERGHSQILWLLLECGSNYNHVCKSGYTALRLLKAHSKLSNTQAELIMASHIQRVTCEFQKQVSLTLNGNAKVVNSVFQPQIFNVCDEDVYEYEFDYGTPSIDNGIGHLLFIGHAVFANQEVKCRLFGPCAVKSVTLNGHHLPCFTEEGNFVLAFCPLREGRNLLRINMVKTMDEKTPLYEGKLVVCAFKAQLL